MAHVNVAVLYLLDPKYIDQKLAVIEIPINGTFNTLTEYGFSKIETGKEQPQLLSNFLII